MLCYSALRLLTVIPITPACLRNPFGEALAREQKKDQEQAVEIARIRFQEQEE